MKMRSVWLGCLAGVAGSALAAEYGTFETPANDARMKFRYWIPDASVDIPTVQKDIKAAASLGAGTIELLPLYNYGASLAGPPEGADWATCGFGTPSFNAVFKAALQAAKDAGIKMDFALGPNQGQGVPSKTTDSGLHWDLAPFHVVIPTNGSYDGQIPGWGTGELVSLVSAHAMSTSRIINPASSLFSTPANNASELVLSSTSLQEQTEQVSVDGKISLSLNTTTHGRYYLFAFYQYQDLVKNLDIENHTTGTIFDNGSYTVDHYSSSGAETVKNFWETYILNDTTIKTLLSEVGTYGWEDSIEITSNISWSPSLPARFESLTGYSIRKYLPLVMYGNNNPGTQPSYPGKMKCILNTEDQGAGVVNDFREALAQGYGEYLETLTSWMEGLGLGYSAQISYNLPMDMETNIDRVSAPECESLAFNDNIDGYRQFSGAANIAQKNVISNEMGAVLEKALAHPLSELLVQVNIAFSGGINQIVLHGQTFSGEYYQTTWPGYLGFFLQFADSFMEKQPSWLWGYPDAISYISRNEYILHQGNPRTDVAFFNKVSYTDPQLGTLYPGDDLTRAGYTYSYLNPHNLNRSEAYVSGSLLAPESPAYQALVVVGFENITLEAVSTIQKFADAGLPIIMTDKLPGYYPTGTSTSKNAVVSALKSLRASDNVHVTSEGNIAAKLESLDISPRVGIVTAKNATWYPVMRSNGSADYVYIFNEGAYSVGHIVVNSTKTPYTFNSWTGERLPLLHYQVQGSKTEIPLTLASNETVVLAFIDDWNNEIETPRSHATQVPANIIGYNYTSSAGLVLHATANSTASSGVLRLSNGKSYDTATDSALPSFSLHNWTLVAEHWKAPENMSDAALIAVKHNTTHHLSSLVSWLDIPGLHNTSGLGFYSTQFHWSKSDSNQKNATSGAYLSLPPISHGLKLFVNDQPVQTLDFANPLVDISPFLKYGTNKISATVPTIMWNYIRSIYDELLISGCKPLLSADSLPSTIDTGLIGEAKIIPYTNLHVAT